MSARITNAQVLAAFESIAARLDALEAPAPVPAPVVADPATGFLGFIHARAASKVACEIHAPESCTRRFVPTSRGRTNHVARKES